MGDITQKTVEDILDYYHSQGGNFIDTSNNYQFNQSEQWIGEWMAKRGVRDQIVLATKYSINWRATQGDANEIQINFQGNNAKSLHLSVKHSLETLQTDYIDILYVHWHDFTTSIPEIMHSLNNLVVAGKVLYLGISDTPAWIVAKANEYARGHGLRTFSVYQGNWNAGKRDFEREIIPMVRSEGMALVPWGVLGSGKFKSAERRAQDAAKAGASGRSLDLSEQDIRISDALEAVGKRKGGVSVQAVAQAYVMHKAPYVFPLVGGRSVEHLKANIEALKVALDEKDIQEIEGGSEFVNEVPNDFVYGPKTPANPGDTWLMSLGGTSDLVAPVLPIRPQQ